MTVSLKSHYTSFMGTIFVSGIVAKENLENLTFFSNREDAVVCQDYMATS